MDINPEAQSDKRKQISSSKKTYKKVSPWQIASVILIVLLAITVIYLAMPKKENSTVSATQNMSEASRDTSLFKDEHFYKHHHHEHLDKEIETSILMPDEEKMLEKGYLSDKQRKLLDLMPNAPTIHLYNLKLTDYQKLYYKPDGNPVEIHDTAAPVLISLALKNFNKLQFDAALLSLNTLLRLNEQDPNTLFYAGVAYYYQKNYPKALIMLNRIGNLSNNIFKQEAYWYKALCFIDLQKNSEAKTLLQHITETQGFYAAKAKQLSTSLK